MFCLLPKTVDSDEPGALWAKPILWWAGQSRMDGGLEDIESDRMECAYERSRRSRTHCLRRDVGVGTV